MGVKLLAVLVLIERALLLGVAWARSGGFHPSGRLIEIDKAVLASCRGINCIGIASPRMGAVVSWRRHSLNDVPGSAPLRPRLSCAPHPTEDRVRKSEDTYSSSVANQVTHTTVSADVSVVVAGLPSDCVVLLDSLVNDARDEAYVFGVERPRGSGHRLVQALARRVHGRSLSARSRPAGVRVVALTRRAMPPFDVAMLELDPLGAVHDCEAVAIGNEAEGMLCNYTDSTPISDMQPSDVLGFVASVLLNASLADASRDLELSVSVLSHGGPPTVLRGLRLHPHSKGKSSDSEAAACSPGGSSGKEVSAVLRIVRRAVLRALQKEAAKAINHVNS